MNSRTWHHILIHWSRLAGLAPFLRLGVDRGCRVLTEPCRVVGISNQVGLLGKGVGRVSSSSPGSQKTLCSVEEGTVEKRARFSALITVPLLPVKGHARQEGRRVTRCFVGVGVIKSKISAGCKEEKEQYNS